jgi:Uma2 family endonuclease
LGISAETFERLALEDADDRWELHCGRLVRRPGMTMPHNEVAMQLALIIGRQIDRTRYRLRSQAGHLRYTDANYFIPDVSVLPAEETAEFRGRPVLEKYDGPLPFVAEVWSPSTAEYDVDSKLPEYQKRGDREIWRVHPFEKAVTAWRRQSDGSYSRTDYGGTGVVEIASLPGVVVPLDELFEWV